MKTPRILIVGDLSRSALATARALKIASCYNIRAMCRSRGSHDILYRYFKPYYINSIHFVDKDYIHPSFVDDLIKIINDYKIDVVIPTAASAIALSKVKFELMKFCKVAIEDYDRVINFHDKSKIVNMARELDIPHPSTLITTSFEKIEDFGLKANYPIVIKGRRGMAANAVWYAKSFDELMNSLRKITERENCGDGLVTDWSNPILQEYIPGELQDVAAFCVKGEIKAGLTQKRLVTKPLSGGQGIVNKTTHNEELLVFARKIVSHTKWSGVLLFDFKIDERDGIPKLLEVNPRLWGTVGLSVRAGLNYPHYLVQYALGEIIEYPSSYKVGLTCRWPIKELEVIVENPVTLLAIRERIKGFISRFRCRNCEYDINIGDIDLAMTRIVQVFLMLCKKVKQYVWRKLPAVLRSF